MEAILACRWSLREYAVARSSALVVIDESARDWTGQDFLVSTLGRMVSVFWL